MRHQLANGMEMVVCPRDGANVVSIQCIIWAGSLDENEREQGIAHFLEHMLFKGTKKRGVGKIASLIEGAGGDSNAYTTFDRTVFHVTLPSASAELGFDVLSDALFSSIFDATEFEKEREVILEEIRRDLDSPSAELGRAIHQDLYEATQAGRPICGSITQIASVDRQTLLDFWQKWYQPPNMSLVVVGQLAEDEALELAGKYFGSQSTNSHVVEPGSGRHRNLRRQRRGRIRALVLGREVEQSRLHVVLGAPSIDSPDCPLVDTAAYALGGSEVSRLQLRLQEKLAVVNAIGASSYSSSFEGLFEISAVLDPQKIPEACAAIGRELALLIDQEPINNQEVERSRAAAKIAKIHREETVDGIASAIVAGLTTPLKEKFEGYYDHLANSFTPQEMTATLRRHWDLNDALIIVLCDDSIKPQVAELENSFRSAVSETLAQTRTHKPKPTTQNKSIQVHEFTIGNGVPVIYREIPHAMMFSLTATTEGGQRGEVLDTAGTFYAMAGLLGLASQRRGYEEFVGRLEDLGAILSGFSGKDSFGLNMQCILPQVDEMIRHTAEAMLEPHFPEDQWQVNLRETLESIKMQADSFEWVCMRRLHLKVFGNHPYVLPIVGFEGGIKALSAKQLQDFFVDWRDSGKWVFAAAGGAPASMVRETLSQAFAAFKPRCQTRHFSFKCVDDLGSRLMNIMPKRIPEQAQLAIGGIGPSWSSPNREAVDVLLTALSGQGGRLFSILREDESLAYTVGPLHSQGIGGGLVGAHMATSKDKLGRARESLERELHKISARGVLAEELEWAKSYLLGSHDIGLQRTSSQAMTMALMHLYGLGWNDFMRYRERLRQVSLHDVAKVAEQYFKQPALNVITIGV